MTLQQHFAQLETLRKIHDDLSAQHKQQGAELRAAKESAFDAESRLATTARENEQTKIDVSEQISGSFETMPNSTPCKRMSH